MKPKQLPLQLLSYIYPGTHRDWWRKRANSGQLGPVCVEAGKVRNRAVDTAEVESRFGAITEDQYASAILQYEADRRLVRKAP